jgi:2-methylcitrate dehydratase PrpD
MKKVSVQVDPELEGLYPYQRGSIVEVYTMDGSKHAARVAFPLGEPENPLPDSFLRDKFRQAAGAFLSGDNLDRLETMLRCSGPVESAATLFGLTCQNIQPR